MSSFGEGCQSGFGEYQESAFNEWTCEDLVPLWIYPCQTFGTSPALHIRARKIDDGSALWVYEFGTTKTTYTGAGYGWVDVQRMVAGSDGLYLFIRGAPEVIDSGGTVTTPGTMIVQKISYTDGTLAAEYEFALPDGVPCPNGSNSAGLTFDAMLTTNGDGDRIAHCYIGRSWSDSFGSSTQFLALFTMDFTTETCIDSTQSKNPDDWPYSTFHEGLYDPYDARRLVFAGSQGKTLFYYFTAFAFDDQNNVYSVGFNPGSQEGGFGNSTYISVAPVNTGSARHWHTSHWKTDAGDVTDMGLFLSDTIGSVVDGRDVYANSYRYSAVVADSDGGAYAFGSTRLQRWEEFDSSTTTVTYNELYADVTGIAGTIPVSMRILPNNDLLLLTRSGSTQYFQRIASDLQTVLWSKSVARTDSPNRVYDSGGSLLRNQNHVVNVQGQGYSVNSPEPW